MVSTRQPQYHSKSSPMRTPSSAHHFYRRRLLCVSEILKSSSSSESQKSMYKEFVVATSKPTMQSPALTPMETDTQSPSSRFTNPSYQRRP